MKTLVKNLLVTGVTTLTLALSSIALAENTNYVNNAVSEADKAIIENIKAKYDPSLTALKEQYRTEKRTLNRSSKTVDESQKANIKAIMAEMEELRTQMHEEIKNSVSSEQAAECAKNEDKRAEMAKNRLDKATQAKQGNGKKGGKGTANGQGNGQNGERRNAPINPSEKGFGSKGANN